MTTSLSRAPRPPVECTSKQRNNGHCNWGAAWILEYFFFTPWNVADYYSKFVISFFNSSDNLLTFFWAIWENYYYCPYFSVTEDLDHSSQWTYLWQYITLDHSSQWTYLWQDITLDHSVHSSQWTYLWQDITLDHSSMWTYLWQDITLDVISNIRHYYVRLITY